MPKFRSAYDRYPVDGITFTYPTMAQQHFKDECDVNNILRKYETTGLLTHVANGTPSYGDFSSVLEFMDAQNILIAAQDAFDALPASLRKRFDNDPAVMLSFLEDPNNREEAEQLGLVSKQPSEDGEVAGSVGSTDLPGHFSNGSIGDSSKVKTPNEGSEQLPT